MNMPALLAATNIARAGERSAASMRRLSSGFRINSSMDDPSGMSITNRMSHQIAGTQQASNSSSNGISIVQTAEGGLQEIHNILQRIRELTIQAKNYTNVEEDRELIHKEIVQLNGAVNEMANGTQFNGINLLAQHNFAVRTNTAYNTHMGNPGIAAREFILPDRENNPADRATHLENDGIRSHILADPREGDVATHVFDPVLGFRPPVGEEVPTHIVQDGRDMILADHIVDDAGTVWIDDTATHMRNDGRHVILPDPDAVSMGWAAAADAPTHIIEVPRLLIQIGANMDQQMRMNLVDARSFNLGLVDMDGFMSFSVADIAADVDGLFSIDGVDGHDFRTDTLNAVDRAIQQISEMRGTFGSYQNRLEHTVNSLDIMDENLQAARMRIRDADMAFEMTELSISRVIEQSGLAILAQANMRPQQILQLLQ